MADACGLFINYTKNSPTKQTPSFLFVNKHALSSTLTRSDRSEKANILSHVQQRRRRRGRKSEKSKPGSSESTISVANSDEQTERHRQAVQDPTNNLLQFYPTHNDTDPFRCTVAGDVHHIQAMLSYAFFSFSKSTFLAEALAPLSVSRTRHQMRHNDIMLERLRRCVHDEMLMYSTLAYGSSAMAWTLGKFDRGRPPEYFIDKALASVRIHLSDPSRKADTWLLLSIYSLAITEMWNSLPQMWAKTPTRRDSMLKTVTHSRAASRIHLQAMVELVKSIGGWHKVDAYVLESMILVDKFSAMIDMEKPILPTAQPVFPIIWAPKPLIDYKPEYQHVKSTSSLRRLGKSFILMKLDNELAKVLQDIADFCQTAQWIWSIWDVSANDESRIFLHLQSLNYRLLLFDDLPSAENCVRVAALLFLQNIMHYQGAQMSAILGLRHFKLALQQAADIQQSWDDEFMLWILCTGAISTDNTEERKWFIERLADMCIKSSLDLRGVAFRDLLEGYLFIWEKQDSRLYAMIEHVNQTISST